jgi:hypothetical protein
MTAALALLLILALSGCELRQADKVSYNVSNEADAFNVVRRLTVMNMRSDTVLLQMTGTFSIKTDSDGDLDIICELEDGRYQKHFVHLNSWTTYVVEDISGSDVSKHSYELNFLPLVIPNVKIVATD